MADEWLAHVLPHSPIQELAPKLWHVTGSIGLAPREMILYQLHTKTLFLVKSDRNLVQYPNGKAA